MSGSLAAKTIVDINSYHEGYPWSDRCLIGFSQEIAAENTIISYQMDTKRIPQRDFEARANKIWAKLLKVKPDIVVTMDDNALKYFGQRVVDELAVPLVFMGVNHNPREYFDNHKIPALVSGVMERPLIEQNLLIISEILALPHKKILLMMDEGISTKSFIESVFDNKSFLLVEGIRVDVCTFRTFTQWQASVQAAPSYDYDVLIVGSYGRLRNSDNAQIPVTKVSEWTSANSKLPVFSFWLNEAGKGKAIGGLVMTGLEHGASAADIVNIILSTSRIPSIKRPHRGKLIFSQHELSRWGITLPDYLRKRSDLIE